MMMVASNHDRSESVRRLSGELRLYPRGTGSVVPRGTVLHTAPDFPSRNIENAHRRNGQRLLGRRYCRLTRDAPLAQLAGQVTLNQGRSEVEFTGLICYLFRATVSTYLLRECGREQMILTPAAWFPRQRALHEEVRRRAKSPSCRLPLLHPIPPG